MMLALSGLHARMVASCSGVNTYESPIALVVDASSALVYYAQNWLFDDHLEALASHSGAGFWCLILIEFLASQTTLAMTEMRFDLLWW